MALNALKGNHLASLGLKGLTLHIAAETGEAAVVYLLRLNGTYTRTQSKVA